MMHSRIGPSLPSAGIGPRSFDRPATVLYLRTRVQHHPPPHLVIGVWSPGAPACKTECGVIGGCAPRLVWGQSPIHSIGPMTVRKRCRYLRTATQAATVCVCLVSLCLSLSLRVLVCVCLCLISLYVCACGCVWTYDGQG